MYFVLENYSITCLFKQSYINIKISNNTSFFSYKTKINITDITYITNHINQTTPLNIEDIYKIMITSFLQDDSYYSVRIDEFNKFIKLTFNEFEISLNQDILSLEQLQEKVEKLDLENSILRKKVEKHDKIINDYLMILLKDRSSTDDIQYMVQYNISELNMTINNKNCMLYKYDNIELLPMLESLSLVFYCDTYCIFENIKSTSVTKLRFTNRTHKLFTLKSLSNFPNITELILENIDIINLYKILKTPNKITKIDIVHCYFGKSVMSSEEYRTKCIELQNLIKQKH